MSITDGIPVGLFDPILCRKSRWTIAMAEMTKGSRKCRAKNRVSVALSMENAPQTHSTRFVPMYSHTSDSREQVCDNCYSSKGYLVSWKYITYECCGLNSEEEDNANVSCF